MEPFYVYHPGSAIGQSLYKAQEKLVSLITISPSEGISLLVEKFNFGRKSDFWDDFIFLTVISPALANISKLKNIKDAINKYCDLDHSLFLTYIRRDEEPERFRRAFWNVNSYGLRLSSRFKDEYLLKQNISNKNFDALINRKEKNQSLKKIAFVFKGGFSLAHAEFFEEFLRGAAYFKSKVKITLILLDDIPQRLSNRGLDHVEVIALR